MYEEIKSKYKEMKPFYLKIIINFHIQVWYGQKKKKKKKRERKRVGCFFGPRNLIEMNGLVGQNLFTLILIIKH